MGIPLLSLMLILNLSTICQGVVEDKYLLTKHFRIPVNGVLEGSRILGYEPAEGDCDEGQKNYFVFKGSIQDLNNFTNKVTIIESWTRLKEMRGKYFESGLLNKITSSDFSEYNFAVVLIVFFGTQHLENGRLYEDNHKLYFSYEIWEKQFNEVPACAWERLYVLKLGKSPSNESLPDRR
jgi:hypothetical protein